MLYKFSGQLIIAAKSTFMKLKRICESLSGRPQFKKQVVGFTSLLEINAKLFSMKSFGFTSETISIWPKVEAAGKPVWATAIRNPPSDFPLKSTHSELNGSRNTSKSAPINKVPRLKPCESNASATSITFARASIRALSQSSKSDGFSKGTFVRRITNNIEGRRNSDTIIWERLPSLEMYSKLPPNKNMPTKIIIASKMYIVSTYSSKKNKGRVNKSKNLFVNLILEFDNMQIPKIKTGVRK